MPHRIIQCFTGAIGSAAIRLAAEDPRVALVGLLVHHEEKEGVDAGELAGIGSLGVAATRDVDSLLGLDADCAIWSGAWDTEIVSRFLRAGVDVYSGTHAFYLRSEPDFDQLEAACLEGGATLAGGGNIPGLISDVAPLFLSGYSGRIRQVRAWQRNHVPDLASAGDLTLGVGFGTPCAGADTERTPTDRVGKGHCASRPPWWRLASTYHSTNSPCRPRTWLRRPRVCSWRPAELPSKEERRPG